MNSRLLVAAASLICGFGCAHVPNQDRYRTKVQVVQLAECPKLEGLRQFELGLFKAGFVREVVREAEPISFELLDNLVSAVPRLVTFSKSDFEVAKSGTSHPYRELTNHYRIAACEEPAGALFLIVVRHDPTTGDQFLGTRFSQAVKASSCQLVAVAPPRDLGLFQEGTEEDLLRHIQRGRCRDYGKAR